MNLPMFVSKANNLSLKQDLKFEQGREEKLFISKCAMRACYDPYITIFLTF